MKKKTKISEFSDLLCNNNLNAKESFNLFRMHSSEIIDSLFSPPQERAGYSQMDEQDNAHRLVELVINYIEKKQVTEEKADYAIIVLECRNMPCVIFQTGSDGKIVFDGMMEGFMDDDEREVYREVESIWADNSGEESFVNTVCAEFQGSFRDTFLIETKIVVK